MRRHAKLFVSSILIALLLGCQAAPKSEVPKQEPVTQIVDPTYLHSASGMFFPEHVGEFKRVEANRFNESGTDMGVKYSLHTKDASAVADVYIYPVVGQPVPGSELSQTMKLDALAKNMLCNDEIETRKQELKRYHPDSGLSAPEPVTLHQGDAERSGVRIWFYGFEKYGSQPENIKSDFYLFCFATEQFTIAYRFTYPAYSKVTEPIATFMRELRWPPR